MKKLLVTLCAFACLFSSLHSNEEKAEQPPIKNNYRYVSYGIGPLPIPAPHIGIGYKTQTSGIGSDISIRWFSLVVVNNIRADGNILFFPNYRNSSAPKIFTGLGLSAGIVEMYFFDLDHNNELWIKGYLSPQILFGCEWGKNQKTRFFKTRINCPHYYYHPKRKSTKGLYFPTLTLEWGHSF